MSVVRPRPRAREAHLSLFDVAELDLSELARRSTRHRAGDVYLHPAQLEVARRRYNGPCRIRGPAGCGKTVVALHRAAYLAPQEPGDILFVTYVRTLPRVLATLDRRPSPHTPIGCTSRGVHQLALQVLRHACVSQAEPASRGDCLRSRLGPGGAGAPGDARAADVYWVEEVRAVTKGRDLQSYEDHASLARTGRRTRLSADQRKRVWDLFVRYEQLFEEKGVQDFADVVALAVKVADAGVRVRRTASSSWTRRRTSTCSPSD